MKWKLNLDIILAYFFLFLNLLRKLMLSIFGILIIDKINRKNSKWFQISDIVFNNFLSFFSLSFVLFFHSKKKGQLLSIENCSSIRSQSWLFYLLHIVVQWRLIDRSVIVLLIVMNVVEILINRPWKSRWNIYRI